jgi:hypothetical protein
MLGRELLQDGADRLPLSGLAAALYDVSHHHSTNQQFNKLPPAAHNAFMH